MQDWTACICGTPPPSDLSPIASFSEARAGCPALRELFLPDSIWPEIKGRWEHPDDTVSHRSVLWEAYRCGCLNRVTSPIHRFLLTAAGTLRGDTRPQYVKDLQERWLLYQEPLERHQKWKAFHGRLVELQFAEWLGKEKSYEITGLEALGAQSDVETVSPSGSSAAFEVKFIGPDDADFEMQLKSLKGEAAAGFVSPDAAINRLAFSVYKAARQLQNATTKKTAAIIVDGCAWWKICLQLREKWIDWADPKFVHSHEGWSALKYPGLPDDLGETIRSINSIWILQTSEFEFLLKYEIPISEGEP